MHTKHETRYAYICTRVNKHVCDVCTGRVDYHGLLAGARYPTVRPRVVRRGLTASPSGSRRVLMCRTHIHIHIICYYCYYFIVVERVWRAWLLSMKEQLEKINRYITLGWERRRYYKKLMKNCKTFDNEMMAVWGKMGKNSHSTRPHYIVLLLLLWLSESTIVTTVPSVMRSQPLCTQPLPPQYFVV